MASRGPFVCQVSSPKGAQPTSFSKMSLVLGKGGSQGIAFQLMEYKKKARARRNAYLKSKSHFTFCPELMTLFALGPSPGHLNFHCSLAPGRRGESHLDAKIAIIQNNFFRLPLFPRVTKCVFVYMYKGVEVH